MEKKSMVWQDDSRQLKDVLGFDESPVAVIISNTPAVNGKETKTMPCNAFYQAARKGVTLT